MVLYLIEAQLQKSRPTRYPDGDQGGGRSSQGKTDRTNGLDTGWHGAC